MYYNTTNLQGEELKGRRFKASAQASTILEFFLRNPDQLYTPFDVQRENAMWITPITSIRRAMTVLTAFGYLEKTEQMKPGRYRAINHMWRLHPSKRMNYGSMDL